jgi:hypothetical protein
VSAAARAVTAGALAAVALGACGGDAGDLMAISRTGDLPGARLELRFTADGRVSCNRGPLRDLPSDRVLEVRTAARELAGDEDTPGPAATGLTLPPGPAALLRYDVRVAEGRVRFSDSGAPPLLGRLVRLTRRIATGTCGLAR